MYRCTVIGLRNVCVRAPLCQKKREIGVRVLCWTSRRSLFRRAHASNSSALKTVATRHYQQSTKDARLIFYLLLCLASRIIMIGRNARTRRLHQTHVDGSRAPWVCVVCARRFAFSAWKYICRMAPFNDPWLTFLAPTTLASCFLAKWLLRLANISVLSVWSLNTEQMFITLILLKTKLFIKKRFFSFKKMFCN